jgi:hypothetical protein
MSINGLIMGRYFCPNTNSSSSVFRFLRTKGGPWGIFSHKQLSFSFAEAKATVKTAERLRFPLMSGSSMPVTWRLPDVDVPAGAYRRQ